MNIFNSLIGNEPCCEKSTELVKRITPLQQLEGKRKQLAERLETLDKTIEFFKKNPTFVEGIELLVEVNRY